MWIFTELQSAGTAGATFTSTLPWCIVLHTTEVSADPVNWVPTWRSPSHLVVDPKRRTAYQCLPLNRAAKSLWNEPGGVETNLRPCIQIEINTSSPATGTPDPLTEDDYRWLGEEIIRPVVAAIQQMGGDINLDQVRPPWPTGNSARVNAPQRMSFAEWNSFNGVCCHAEVPENDHWDVGAINRAKIAAYAKIEEIDDMFTDEDRQMLKEFRDYVVNGHLVANQVNPELEKRTLILLAEIRKLPSVLVSQASGVAASAAAVAEAVVTRLKEQYNK